MRVAVLCFQAGTSKELAAIAAKLADSFTALGHHVDVIDPSQGYAKLAAADFVALGAEPTGLFGSLPALISEKLKAISGLGGKRSMAFLKPKTFGAEKALLRLMSVMEAEGMRLVYGQVLRSPAEADQAARQAPVNRN